MTEVQSGTKQSEVAKIYGVPRYTISIMLLPGNKEQTKSALQFERLAQKEKMGGYLWREISSISVAKLSRQA